ncbi:MAG: hypothetical protein GY858_09370 [Candidatus Omnitrophica bacterium]|nr:hypothetical protein [Candidatus Omnitrophota bacterium]
MSKLLERISITIVLISIVLVWPIFFSFAQSPKHIPTQSVTTVEKSYPNKISDSSPKEGSSSKQPQPNSKPKYTPPLTKTTPPTDLSVNSTSVPSSSTTTQSTTTKNKPKPYIAPKYTDNPNRSAGQYLDYPQTNTNISYYDDLKRHIKPDSSEEEPPELPTESYSSYERQITNIDFEAISTRLERTIDNLNFEAISTHLERTIDNLNFEAISTHLERTIDNLNFEARRE